MAFLYRSDYITRVKVITIIEEDCENVSSITDGDDESIN